MEQRPPLEMAGEQLCFKSSGFSLEMVFIPRFIRFHNGIQNGEQFVHASDDSDLFGFSFGEQSFIEWFDD
jgi:ribosomal protein S19